MAGPRQQAFRFPGFPQGANNVYREDDLPQDTLRKAINVDLLEQGKVSRRKGYTQQLSLTSGRSLFSHHDFLFLADENQIVSTAPPTWDTNTIGPVHPEAHLSFETLNQYLYYTDGRGNAQRIDDFGAASAWSTEQPAGQPDLSALSMGSLPAGDYQVAVVFLRGREESGTSQAARAEIISTTGSIQVTNIPQPQSMETTGIRLYMTHAGGEQFFAYGDFSVGTTSATLSTMPQGKALETQFLEPVPPGHIVRQYNGRLYTAVDNLLVFSQPLRYGLHRPTEDYIEFSGHITMVRPTESGIYVSAGKRVIFLAGRNPDTFEQHVAHTSGAVEGTDIMAPAGMFSFENLSTGEVAVWWAQSGVMIIGFPNGQVQPLREGELSLPEFTRGSILVREQDGVRQLLSVLSEPKLGSSLAASDSVTMTVHRNGIEL